MIKTFVFDTNAMISAHLLPSSTSRKAYDLALKKGIIVFSDETIREFGETFKRKKFDKYLDHKKREDAILFLQKVGLLVGITTKITECRDPKDNKFLELAVDSNADCIITGDNDLLALHPFHGIPVLSANEFMNLFY